MKDRLRGTRTLICYVLLFAVWLVFTMPAAAEAPVDASVAFDRYAGIVEARLAQQHRSIGDFLANAAHGGQMDARLHEGELVVEKLSPESDCQPKDALLHHWRGTAFVPGATTAEFKESMKNFSAYPERFAPQVTMAKILSPQANPVSDHFTAMMRVRQRHVITVVMDTTYNIAYGKLDAQHGYSASRSVDIREIADAGTGKEHALEPGDEHGFLWRLNSYWSYEERDGGLYIQIESISLTRGIPAGLGWVIGPFVESVPRESLEFTLRSTRNALQKQLEARGATHEYALGNSK
jgi:hypothetical protein